MSGTPLPSQEEDAPLEYFGFFQTNVVGIQYYAGRIGRQEMMLLVRDPQNPYDRWAVRVENIRGIKVGSLRIRHWLGRYDVEKSYSNTRGD